MTRIEEDSEGRDGDEFKQKRETPLGAKKGRLKGDFQKGMILSKRTMAQEAPLFQGIGRL